MDGMDFTGREIVQLLFRTRQIPRVVLSHKRAVAIIFDMRNVIAQQAHPWL